MQVPYRQNLAYARFCHSLRRARPFCRSATFSPFHRGNLPRGGSGRRNILLNCLTKICLLLRKSKNFAVIVKRFIFRFSRNPLKRKYIARRQASLPPSGEVAAKPTIGDKAEVTAKRQTSLFSSEV